MRKMLHIIRHSIVGRRDVGRSPEATFAALDAWKCYVASYWNLKGAGDSLGKVIVILSENRAFMISHAEGCDDER